MPLYMGEPREKVIPKPLRISQWGTKTEIIYSCPECNNKHPLVNDPSVVNYCFSCGVPFDTEKVYATVAQEFADAYHDERTSHEDRKAMMKELYVALIKQ